MRLSQILADLAAGRSVSAADFARLKEVCRRADEQEVQRGDASEKPGGGDDEPQTGARVCRRCGMVTRHVYCPGCGERLVP